MTRKKPRTQPGELGSGAALPAWLRRSFERAITEAEAVLISLGRNPNAWWEVRPYFGKEGLPVFVHDWVTTERLLGPMYDPAKRTAMATRENPIATELRTRARAIAVAENLNEGQAFGLALQRNPDLAREGLKRNEEVPPVLLEMPAWAAAFQAAVANAALGSKGNLRVVVGTVAFLERQRVIEHLDRELEGKIRDYEKTSLLVEIRDGKQNEVTKATYRAAGRERQSSDPYKGDRERAHALIREKAAGSSLSIRETAKKLASDRQIQIAVMTFHRGPYSPRTIRGIISTHRGH